MRHHVVKLNSMTSFLHHSHIYGRLAILGSAFCFYLATVALRWSKAAGLALDSPYFVFSRFLMGFLAIGALFLIKRHTLRPRRFDLLLGRAMFNLTSVLCFFKAVEMTTAAESNVLNMTYPLFVTIFSWFLFKKQRDVRAVGMVLLAFLGILLVFSPGSLQIDPNNLWGLTSGFLAAIAMLFLNRVRQYNDTDTVLFFVFSIGTVLIFIFFHGHLYVPSVREMLYLGFSAFMGFSGQYLLTIGFRYVTAVEGSIISTTRILLAAFLGPILTSDPATAWPGWIGAILIFAANIYFATRKVK